MMPDATDKIMQEMLNAPGARDRVVQGFARHTTLTPEQEKKFRAEATAMGHDPKSFDDPTYDMRAAWLAGRLNPPTMHGSSDFKGLAIRVSFFRSAQTIRSSTHERCAPESEEIMVRGWGRHLIHNCSASGKWSLKL